MNRIARALAAQLIIAAAVIAIVFDLSSTRAAEADVAEAPRFEVDPMWPKPLPNHWILGSVVGVAVDAQDHIWIVHRPNSLEATEIWAASNPPAAECCVAAPPVLEFDEAGNVVNHWGGPGDGYDWPQSMH